MGSEAAAGWSTGPVSTPLSDALGPTGVGPTAYITSANAGRPAVRRRLTRAECQGETGRMDVSHGLALGIVALAAAIDIQTRRIPNFLTFGGALAALALHAATGGWTGLGASAAGWLVGASLFFPLYALRGLGAGDVKLLAAVGACLGPWDILRASLYTVLAGGLLALAVGTIRGYNRQALRNLWALLAFWRAAGVQPYPALTVESATGPRLAYGTAIAAGTFAAVWLK
jgi:prepilin peptidase CpaA